MKESSIFDPAWKLRWHIAVLGLAIIALVLTGVYISMAPFISRAEIMVIPISVKSFIIIGYQLLTQHTRRFAKWRSLKANLILNCIEPAFWLAVVVLKFMGISTFCEGGSCAISWVIAILAIVISVLSVHVAVISFMVFRDAKKYSGA